MIFGFLNILVFFILLSCNFLVWNEEIVVITLLLISFTIIITNLGQSLAKAYLDFTTLFLAIYTFIFKLFIQFNNLFIGFIIFTKYSYYSILVFTLNYLKLTFINLVNFINFMSCQFYIWNFFLKCLTVNNTETNIKSILLTNLKKTKIRVY